MSGPQDALSNSLLQESNPRNWGGKVSVLLAFVAGAGVTMLMSKVTSSEGLTTQESDTNMAWQSVVSKSSVMPAKAMFTQAPALGSAFTRELQTSSAQRNEAVRVNAFPKVSTPTIPSAGLLDVRNALAFPTQKCVNAGPHAAVCGNLVVLRPSTALRAEKFDAEKVLSDVTSKVDAIDNKPQVALYAGGAVVALVVLNGVVTSLESIPLLPKLFEIVGAGYSAYFTYRYLLNKDNRAELVADIEKVKDQVFG